MRSLSENSMVTELDLSYNAMGPQVAMMMSQMLSSGSGLRPSAANPNTSHNLGPTLHCASFKPSLPHSAVCHSVA